MAEWLTESLPENPFDATGKKLRVPLKFSMQDLLEGRKNVEAYSFFWDKFAPILEKKSTFMANLTSAKADKDLLCIASEAFGLLVLENQWDRWVDVYEKSGGRIFIRGNVKIKEVKSDVQPKYTRGGLKNGSRREIGTGKGWSAEGIVRFNQLLLMVHQDRENNPNFIDIWITKRKSELEMGEKKTEVSQVSPEGFACWTLSEIESEGVSDSFNVRKSQIIQQHLNGAAVGTPISEGSQVAGSQIGQSLTASSLPPYRFDPEGDSSHGSKGSSKKKRKRKSKKNHSEETSHKVPRVAAV